MVCHPLFSFLIPKAVTTTSDKLVACDAKDTFTVAWDAPTVTSCVANPKEDVSLTVAGSVSFDNKKFTTGDSKPTLGNYNKGDIVWNTDPKATDYIGWVCVTAGSPGAWLPFGSIARQ